MKFLGIIGDFLSNLFFRIKTNFTNFWSTKDITRKILYTTILLVIYIAGTTITTPFIKLNTGRSIGNNTFFDTLNLVGGGGLQQFSLMALGISPFINASLIMMVLQTKLFPPVYKLSQAGPQGRKKINVITRAITVLVAYPQAVFLTTTLSAGQNSFITIVSHGINVHLITYFYLPMILISASLFALFISEQITNKGIGNGTSLIIFSGIVMRLPRQFSSAYKFLIGDLETKGTFVGVINFGFYILVYLIAVLIISVMYNAERHIPIQQVGAGRSRHVKEMGKLPIKVNPGGVMPIIFALMVISFPIMISNILPDDNFAKNWINTNLQFTKPLGLILLIVITFVFSILMGIQQSRADRIAEDFAKNGTFIPGVRPGEETQDYLIAIVFRLSVFSGFYLVILAIMQHVMVLIGVNQAITFGGTSLMIIVSVSLETWAQLKARNKTTRLAKAKRVTKANFNANNKNGSGLLW